MSETPKKSGFRRWLKPLGMLLLVAGASGIGGFSATYFLKQKSLKPEANHSNAEDSSETATEKMSAENSSSDHHDSNAAKSHSGHDDHASSHNTASSHDLHAAADDHAGAAAHQDEHASGHEDAVYGDSHGNADPFSEESLGLEASLEHDTHDDPLMAGDHVSDDHGKAGAHAIETGHDADDHNSHGADHADEHAVHADSDSASTDLAATHGADEHQDPKSHKQTDHGLKAPPQLSDSHAERKQVLDDHSAASESPQTPTRQDRITQQAVNFMSMADEELAAGNYVEAMRAYQALRKKADGVPGPALLFRLALCAEAAGRHAAAIEAYRRISGTQTDPAWVGIARFGEARCLVAMKRHKGLQSDLLRRAILDETELLPTVRHEVMHLIGRDLWSEQTAIGSLDLLDDQTLIVPEWSADPLRLLDELPLLVHETPTKRGPIEFQVLNVEESDPDGINVRLNCSLTRLDTLIQKLVKGCRLKVDISPAALEVIEGRSQHVAVNDRPLGLLLDGLTIPWGLVWMWKDKAVLIRHPSELTDEEIRVSRLDAAERVLRIAVMEGVNSTQIGHSRLALSTLLFEQGRAADGVQYLQLQIETAPRSVVAAEAGFNLGKCLMVLNERNDAKIAFLRSIDASGGPIEVKVASYIFHCRMLLEEGHHKQAINTMMRGLNLSEGSEFEAWAALQLASVYLLDKSPTGANTVLMNYSDSFAEGDAKGAGAFVSALARFRKAVLVDRREREGADVVAALAEFNPANAPGGHWAVLVASACEELGLSQQAAEAYSVALQRLPPSPLRDATTLKLADHYKAEHDPEKARLYLSTLSSSSQVPELATEAKVVTAQIALEENRLDEAIQLSRDLFLNTKSRDAQRSALRIMGKAYERQQNHEAAIYCFSGTLPETSEHGNNPHSAPEDHGAHR